MTFEVLVWNVFRQSVVYSYHWLMLLAINTVFHLNILRWAKVNSMQHFIGHKQMHSTLHCEFDELQCKFSTYVQRCSGIFCFVLFQWYNQCCASIDWGGSFYTYAGQFYFRMDCLAKCSYILITQCVIKFKLVLACLPR